jgi:monothiol glutaredoxin
MIDIQKTIDSHPVALFMKGNALRPACGFSARVVEILKELDVDFTTVDVLEDEDLRQELKTFSNWPTFPQLYIKGQFIGGSDIVQEMYVAGELEDLLFANDN